MLTEYEAIKISMLCTDVTSFLYLIFTLLIQTIIISNKNTQTACFIIFIVLSSRKNVPTLLGNFFLNNSSILYEFIMNKYCSHVNQKAIRLLVYFINLNIDKIKK